MTENVQSSRSAVAPIGNKPPPKVSTWLCAPCILLFKNARLWLTFDIDLNLFCTFCLKRHWQFQDELWSDVFYEWCDRSPFRNLLLQFSSEMKNAQNI